MKNLNSLVIDLKDINLIIIALDKLGLDNDFFNDNDLMLLLKHFEQTKIELEKLQKDNNYWYYLDINYSD